jgi:hypothetical protein
MVKIKIKVDEFVVKLSNKQLSKFNVSGPGLLGLCIDAIKSLGVDVDEDFIDEYIGAKEPEDNND